MTWRRSGTTPAVQLVGKRPLFDDTPPPWTVGRLGPLLRTPEHSLSSLEARRGLTEAEAESPQLAPTARVSHLLAAHSGGLRGDFHSMAAHRVESHAGLTVRVEGETQARWS